MDLFKVPSEDKNGRHVVDGTVYALRYKCNNPR